MATSPSKHQIPRSKIADVGEVLTKQKGEAMSSGRCRNDSKPPRANVAGCPLLPAAFVCSDRSYTGSRMTTPAST